MKTFSLNCFHSPHLCKALFLFCLFLFFLQAKAADLSDYNRQKLFTFTLTDVSVRTVIKHIEKQSEYVFLYTEDKVDDKRRVTVKATNNTIVQVLEKMFQGTSVVWEIRDRQILLKAGEEKENIFSYRKRTQKDHSGIGQRPRGRTAYRCYRDCGRYLHRYDHEH